MRDCNPSMTPFSNGFGLGKEEHLESIEPTIY